MPATVSVANWASFPSPSQGVWHIGPVPIRAYALCILAGIFAATGSADQRWVARGGSPHVADIMFWAVPFGLVGARLYHVITDAELYFGAGRHPIDALKIWHGGLGIWGAVALGALGAWIACRRAGVPLPGGRGRDGAGDRAGAGVGRFGNYFNQELFGRPTDLPWGLEIARAPPTGGRLRDVPPDVPVRIALEPRRGRAGSWSTGGSSSATAGSSPVRGRLHAGRAWIEILRIDTVNHILGLRLNVWTSIVVFAGGLAYFLLVRGPRETEVEPRRADPQRRGPGPRPPAPPSDAGRRGRRRGRGRRGRHPGRGGRPRRRTPGRLPGPTPAGTDGRRRRRRGRPRRGRQPPRRPPPDDTAARDTGGPGAARERRAGTDRAPPPARQPRPTESQRSGGAEPPGARASRDRSASAAAPNLGGWRASRSTTSTGTSPAAGCGRPSSG